MSSLPGVFVSTIAGIQGTIKEDTPGIELGLED